MVIVKTEECTACEECVNVCPVEAISLKDDKAFIDQSLCAQCLVCVDICPVKAIEEVPSDQ